MNSDVRSPKLKKPKKEMNKQIIFILVAWICLCAAETFNDKGAKLVENINMWSKAQARIRENLQETEVLFGADEYLKFEAKDNQPPQDARGELDDYIFYKAPEETDPRMKAAREEWHEYREQHRDKRTWKEQARDKDIQELNYFLSNRRDNRVKELKQKVGKSASRATPEIVNMTAAEWDVFLGGWIRIEELSEVNLWFRSSWDHPAIANMTDAEWGVFLEENTDPFMPVYDFLVWCALAAAFYGVYHFDAKKAKQEDVATAIQEGAKSYFIQAKKKQHFRNYVVDRLAEKFGISQDEIFSDNDGDIGDIDCKDK
jgi:hypothetical protein